jgi:hypothetical protein
MYRLNQNTAKLGGLTNQLLQRVNTYKKDASN